MKKYNISFKKHPKNTGLMTVGYSNPNVDIKLNKKVIGEIIGPNWNTKDDKWRICFSVMKKESEIRALNNNPNCSWKWVEIAKKFDTENEAREYIKKCFNSLFDKYEFFDIENQEIWKP